MPFSEKGIVPDCIINPNAFPSRMTMGMMLEMMLGKSFATNGEKLRFDTFDKVDSNYAKELLLKSGFKKTSNEKLFSGITGNYLTVEIFEGVVYY